MASSDSDLTDIEEDIPLASRMATEGATKSVSGKDGEGYKIKGALKAPRSTTFTTQALYDQLHGNDINLDADYQREVVWPDTKQIGLIDSVFRNFYIPPIIFVVKYGSDGSERRVCVDGKQRLTSIWRFMDGLIPYKDAFTGERFVFKENGRTKGKLLPERYRKIFSNKQIVCMEYTDLTDADEREIFQRVQLGMALTPAERLQALSTPMAGFIRDLVNAYVVDGLADGLDWDTARASDFRGIASTAYTVAKWPQLTSLPSFAQLEKWVQEDEEPENRFQEHMHATLSIFLALVRDEKLSKVFKLSGVRKVSPAEFMAITLLIFAHRNKLTLAQLSEAIGKMRKDIRATEVDIRQNSRVGNKLVSFIKDLDPKKLKTDSDNPVAAKSSAVKATTKRKRTVKQDEDEEMEDKPKPAPAQRKASLATSSLTASQAHQMQSPPASKPPSRSPSTSRKDSHPPTPTIPQPPPPAQRPPSRSQADRLAAVRAAKREPNSPMLSRAPPAPPAMQRTQEPRYSSSSHSSGHGPGSGSSYNHSAPHPPDASYPHSSTLPPPPVHRPPQQPPPPSRPENVGASLMARMGILPAQSPPPPPQYQAPYPPQTSNQGGYPGGGWPPQRPPGPSEYGPRDAGWGHRSTQPPPPMGDPRYLSRDGPGWGQPR